MSISFIIRVDDQGGVSVHNGSDEVIVGPDNTGNLGTTPVNLDAANKLIKYDSLTILGFGTDQIVTKVCVKRADCTWYCH